MAQHNKQNKVATIKSFRIERISLSGGRIQPKLILGVETEKQQTFEISEAIIDKDGTETCQGLWLNMDKDGKVAKKSTLNTLLKFFNVESIDDLLEKEVNIRPNPQQYFAIYCK